MPVVERGILDQRQEDNVGDIFKIKVVMTASMIEFDDSLKRHLRQHREEAFTSKVVDTKT